MGRQPDSSPSDLLQEKGTKSRQPVDLFVTSWCGYCKKMEAFLISSGISYNRIDIEADPDGARAFQLYQGNGVPMVRVGRQLIRGYDPDGVLRALEKNK